MWPWFGGYDFNAADNLESALKQAGTKLLDFVTQRGRWAQQYLTYQDRGPQQGWVGTEYTTWARQFTYSQRILAGYVDALGQRAVDVHNRSRDEDLKANKTTSRTRMTYPPPARSQPAPGNTAPNGTEGATPQHLYDYADHATSANDQIRPFYANGLSAAADASPADKAESARLAGDIIRFLRDKVHALDARARIVGEAFELADGGLAGGRAGDNQQFLRMAPQQLDQAVKQTTQQIQAGSQLARYSEQYGMTSHVWDQLRKHQNDPVYMAAFFNNLPAIKVETLLSARGDWKLHPPDGQDYSGVLAQGVASAYAGGLTPSIDKQIVHWLDVTPANRFPLKFYSALAANPQAALNFVSTLTPDDAKKLAAPSESVIDENVVTWQPEFIEVYAAAIKASPDGKPAYALYKDITGAVTSAGTWNPYTTDGQAIEDLVAATAAKTAPNPPAGADQQQLAAWAKTSAATLNQLLMPWMIWFKSTEAHDQQTNDMVKGIVSHIVGAALEVFVPEPEFEAADLVGKVLWGQLKDAAHEGLSELIGDAITAPTEDPQKAQNDLTSATELIGERLAIAKLLAAGAVYPGFPGHEGSQPVPATTANVDAIVQAFNKDDPSSPQQWSIRAPGGDVSSTFFLSYIKNESQNASQEP